MASCGQIALIVFNIVFLLAGTGIFTVGILVQFTKTDYHEFVGDSIIPIASYMLIGAGCFVMLLALAGCCGALTKNRKILGVYILLLIFIFLVETAAAILGFVYADSVEILIEEQVTDGIINKYGYEDYALITNAINLLQHEFECCGYEAPSDWQSSNYYTSTDPGIVTDRGSNIMPASCCIDVNVDGCNDVTNSTLNFDKGCFHKLKDWVSENLMLIGGVGLGIALIQLSGIFLAILLFRQSVNVNNDF